MTDANTQLALMIDLERCTGVGAGRHFEAADRGHAGEAGCERGAAEFTGPSGRVVPSRRVE